MMRSAVDGPPTRDPASAVGGGPPQGASPDDESAMVERSALRNFLVLAGYQVLLRIGWIFKTESIIMPAVLDLLTSQAWLRGCLPLLNRFGQSVPPLLANDWVNTRPRKKQVLFVTSVAMAAAFGLLAAGWPWVGASRDAETTRAPWWAAGAFLLLYAVFFASTGVNQLAFGGLQGKLVAPDRRGRLMWVSNVAGSALAIGFAVWLLPAWLADARRLGQVFAFTAACFLAAAIAGLFAREPRDDHPSLVRGIGDVWGNAWNILRQDANFRRLALAAALFGASFVLFPHYQALGRAALGIQFRDLLSLVVIQNAGTAAFSMWIGPLADRRGNRSALRLLMLLLALAPCLAVLLAAIGPPAAGWYCLVFLLVGMTPVTIRSFNNYALEIGAPADHPRYLSALSLCFAAPIVMSPLAGVVIGGVGFSGLFLAISGLLLLGWGLCWGLSEPREHELVANAPELDRG